MVWAVPTTSAKPDRFRFFLPRVEVGAVDKAGLRLVTVGVDDTGLLSAVQPGPSAPIAMDAMWGVDAATGSG